MAENVAKLQEIAPAASPISRRPRKVVGKWGEEYFLLNLHEVLAFQAEGDVTWIVTAKQRYSATHSLRAIEERLPKQFVPPDPPKHADQYQPDSQDEYDHQPALVGDSEQRRRVYR